jgi:hypothetical protein
MRPLALLLALVCGAVGAFAQPVPPPATAKAIATIAEIRDQATRAAGIPAFVEWLRRCDNVSDIEYRPDILLTTSPPKQWVKFTVDHETLRFLLMRGEGGKVVVVSEQSLRTK